MIHKEPSKPAIEPPIDRLTLSSTIASRDVYGADHSSDEEGDSQAAHVSLAYY